jgi:glycosyltransferase involved in cell wall biosynthesis
MRVLQLAPATEPVPPPAYGGTEAVVSVLTEELVRRGLDVTLCASGDSRTSARLLAVCPRGLRTDPDVEDASPREWAHVSESLWEAVNGHYDLVHNHAGEQGMAFGRLANIPMLTTTHCAITMDAVPIWDRYQGWYNTISESQRREMPDVRGGRYLGAVHNAIDVASFPFSEAKGDHLLFLSRVAPQKGAHLAIDVARCTGRRLLIAGKVDRADRRYYEELIAPEIDGEQIVFLGEANAARKRELYRDARCLLLPLCWEEPFGLVMAEAQACGTPVVALRRGSADEVVEHGETGFLVTAPDELAGAVEAVGEIDPLCCRRAMEQRFSPEVMTDRYIDLYETVLEQSRRARVFARGAMAGVSLDGNGARRMREART